MGIARQLWHHGGIYLVGARNELESMNMLFDTAHAY